MDFFSMPQSKEGVFFFKNPSISAKISKNLPIIVLFYQKFSLYEGFLLFLQQNKEEI